LNYLSLGAVEDFSMKRKRAAAAAEGINPSELLPPFTYQPTAAEK
jgi:hypothetical protein